MPLPREAFPVDRIPALLGAMNPNDRCLFKFMALTGVRICEARLLLVGDIIDSNGQYRRPYVTLAETKGGYRRNVVMHDEVIACLEETRANYAGGLWRDGIDRRVKSDHIEKRFSVDVAVFRPRQTSNNHGWHKFIVRRKNEKPLHRTRMCAPLGYKQDAADRALKKAMAAIGLEGTYGTHSWRKTFAEMLIDGGADIVDAQHLLGHASLSSTVHYVKGISLKRAMEKLNAAYAAGGFVFPLPEEEPKPPALPKPKAFDAGVESY